MIYMEIIKSLRLLILLISILFLYSCEASDNSADIVLTNGKIYTVNDNQPWVESIAIKDGKFIFVGKNKDIGQFIGQNTKKHNLNNAMVLPGIIDAHTHPGSIAIRDNYDATKKSGYPNMPYPASKQEILVWLEKYAKDNPELEMIVAGVWQVDIFGLDGPKKEDLDQVVPDRPVYLLDDTGHSKWVNSAFFRKFGIDKNTPDPSPGVNIFSRKLDGEPAGWIKEAAVMPWFSERDYMAPDQPQLVENLYKVLGHLSKYGVTLLYDGGNSGAEDKVYAAVKKLDDTGRLPLRYEGTYHIRLPDQVPIAISELKRLRSEYSGDRLKFNTIKIHYDGVHEVRTSAIFEPYSDDPKNRGNTIFSGEVLTDFILELHKEKIDLHLHTNSERSAHIALNAVEKARSIIGGRLDTRISTCHLELIHEDDISRFRELDVPANFTLHWNGFGYLTGWKKPIGAERAARRFSIQALIDDGATVSYSSDTTGMTRLYRTSPFFSMQIGHNRQEVGAAPSSEILSPISERLALEDIVNGYTQGGAYQLRYEDSLGSIEVGKEADLVVLDQNIFDVSRYDISKTTPTAVLIAGEVIQGKL